MVEIKSEFMIDRQGKKFVLFAGLLDAWHAQYGEGWSRSIATELLQQPNSMNDDTAVVKAVVRASKEGVVHEFHGIGDASPENVGRNIAPHITRMAETRAKARALRDAVNVGVTAIEEMADGGGGEDAGKPYQRGEYRPTGQGSRGGRAQGERKGGEQRPRAEDSGATRGGAAQAGGPTLGRLKTLLHGAGGGEAIKEFPVPLDELTQDEVARWINLVQSNGWPGALDKAGAA